jgi:hypothetical protein
LLGGGAVVGMHVGPPLDGSVTNDAIELLLGIAHCFIHFAHGSAVSDAFTVSVRMFGCDTTQTFSAGIASIAT